VVAVVVGNMHQKEPAEQQLPGTAFALSSGRQGAAATPGPHMLQPQGPRRWPRLPL